MSTKALSRLAGLVLALVLMVMAFMPAAVQAAGPWYVATTGDDTNDCLSPATPCATINGAIDKPTLGSGDTIFVADGTYLGSLSQPVIVTTNLGISGGWNSSFTSQIGFSTIDGQNLQKLFVVANGVSSSFDHLILQNAGNSQNPPQQAGAIYNSGTLTITDSTIQYSVANYGGGIYNEGSLTLISTTVRNNSSSGQGTQGGGIYNIGNLILNNSVVSGNTSLPGYTSHGIGNLNGSVILNNSTVSGNTGGIVNLNGSVILNNSTVSNNTVVNGGGNIINVTGAFTLNNSTVTANSSTSCTGGIFNNGGTVTLQNSILAGNTSTVTGPNCSGTITSMGYNIIDNNTGCDFPPSTGDLTNVDPLLGPLQNNGGSNQTHALLSGSPAIDAGNPAGCTDQNGSPLTTDQRGVARPQGTRCDIGAFELIPPPEGPWYVATTGNDANDCLNPGTACATINGAINKAASGDTINVATGIYFGTGNEVVLLNKDIILSGGWNPSFTLKDGWSTIDGQGVRRGITVFSTATIEDFIVQSGSLFNTGGGVFNQGILTINNSFVCGNSTDFGGGISNIGTLTLNDSTICGNSATTFGGGILNGGGGTLILNNSTVSRNTSISSGGGGIANSGAVLILNNSTVSGNSTPNAGGGILNAGGLTGTVTLNYTTVSYNSAGGAGGGIANFSSTGPITLMSSIVAGNGAGQTGINSITADCFIAQFLNPPPEYKSLGYNLTGDNTGCFFSSGDGPGDVSIAPGPSFTFVLDPLGDYGGLTETHALIAAGSSNPALDAIPSGTNGCGSPPFNFDQRGVSRPQGGQCDIGAFELEVTNPVLEVVIDIKPGNAINSINTQIKGKIPVAILSTAVFDAPAMVDKASLTFGKTGDEISLASCNKVASDLNHDGLLDLVCQFYTRHTGFQLGDLVGVLRGKTLGGVPLEGKDIVKILK